MTESNGHVSTTEGLSNGENHTENESTALLNGSLHPSNTNYGTVEPNGDVSQSSRPDDYMNRKQVLLLSYCRMVDPVAFFCIVPFINQMILDLDQYPETEVGFYSGLIESLFSLVQMIMMLFWGQIADKFGRKPVLVSSFSGLLVTTSLFGFSKSLWQMILLRCLSGIFSGSVVAVRAMISEQTTPKSQARAFGIFGFFGNFGIFLGVLIGGFAEPAKQYPSVFGKIQFFQDYPYALPTIISGVLVLSSLVVTIFFIEETLDKSKRSQNGEDGPTMSTWEVFTSPGVPIVLLIYMFAGILGLAFTAVAPLTWFTSVKNGGFGLSPRVISYFLAGGGGSQALWMLLVFPPLQARIGTGGVLRACAVVWPISFALVPLANVVLKHHLDTIFWICTPFVIVISSGCAMAFTAVQLTVNDITPSQAALGTLNGIALSLSSGTRAYVPALFSSIYAKGVQDQILWGYLGWAVLIAITFMYAISLYWLPAKAEGRYRPVPQDQPNEE